MKRIVVIALVAAALAAILLAYMFFIHPQYVVPRRVLRVGTSPDFPPFEYISPGGEIVGIDIDLIKALAKRLGYEVEIVSMSFDGLIPALVNNQIDVIASGLTITSERAEVVSFTIPYWDADQAIIVARNSNFRPKGLEDLVDKIVGVGSGTTAEGLLTDFVKDTGKNIDVKSYDSYVLAVKDLVNGRLDAVVIDTPVARSFAESYDIVVSCIVETGEKYGLAVRKNDTELLNNLNKVLEEFLKSKEWQEIINKHAG
ncbi:MAG: basic amino acid ABC transporter substrate-binding protein [Ignisphaera sp.]|nr:basic amino acid ABC transporter substrate-binding protein [Ignisphaera sp.]MCX8167454.1 basic amino acid ABC transporter substrate-binding protein [Ignisphaera sp.]MDW8084682.1 basic amino acid ABC transporter substrate-binding protein [Ignisphaera sp.]